MTGSRRVTTLVTREANPDARFVLAWVQQTLRADNNPLIEAALAHANRRGLPLLIYHGLRQDYPHASARLHRFILGLSAEMSRALNQRGIRCIHYVERPGHQVRGLVYRLAQHAEAVFTDEHFAFVPRDQLAAFAQHSPCSVHAVDTSRLVPTRYIPEGIKSTRGFRAAHQALRADWLAETMTFCTPVRVGESPYHGALPFTPDALECATESELDQLTACCPIDQTVRPTPTHPPSRAIALDRLNYLAQHVHKYPSTRNNPAISLGTSELSPYLHFGAVGPSEVVKAIQDGPSSKSEQWKFLDEMLTWREWAHYLCKERPLLSHFSSIATATLDTLDRHREDVRTETQPLDALIHGCTPDPVWNAAQRQWLETGWMHNNLRMYWGTQLLRFTESPEHAWALGCYLNDRFSLDGRDPATYMNLHWCMQYAKWPREQPIYGFVQRRSSSSLLKRPGVREWVAQANALNVARVRVPEWDEILTLYASETR